MAKKTEFEEIIKNIDFNRAILTIIPLLQPFIIFGAWLTFARMNTKASIVSKIIAIAEPIPTVDSPSNEYADIPKPLKSVIFLVSFKHFVLNISLPFSNKTIEA